MTIEHPGVTRRQFLGAAGAASLLAVCPPRAMADGVIRKTIPASGERLAVIGMGSSRTFEVEPTGEALESLLDVMHAFFAGGGQLIDSSPMYGSAETVIGKLLERLGERQGLFTATKVWTNGRDDGIRQMQRSRERMGVERIDLMQIHNLRDWQVHLETLRDWKQQGRIRYIGITTSHGRYHRELEQILRDEPLDFVQFSYNIVDRDAERRLLPIAAERGIATLINRPYQRGSLFRRVRDKSLPDWVAEFDCASWGQFFLKYIAAHPAVTCVIPATSKAKHMVDNMGANRGRLPDAVLRRRMEQYVASL